MAGSKTFLVLCLFSVLLISDFVDCRKSRSRSQYSGRTSRTSTKSSRTKTESIIVPVPGDCNINYDSVTADHIHPMIVRPSGEEFLYPTMEGKIRNLRIPAGEEVVAACPGRGNRLLLNGLTNAFISCKEGLLYYGRSAVKWSQLGCHKKPRPALKRRSTSCGFLMSSSASIPFQGTSYGIEWPINKDVVVPQIDICFNEDLETTLFTHHKIIGRYIGAKVVEPDRPSFKEEKMFSVSANKVYGKADQKALFFSLLKDLDHLTAKKQHYLARGHLSPDSDFVLEPEQDATYFYANVVPQWQAVNNGNWKSLENSVRELAEKHQATLDIWTGVNDVLHLPNTSNDPVELFLGFSENKRTIPVPALMWKVVYNRSINKAIAIVVLNDVRGFGLGSKSSDLQRPPCRNYCSKIPWVDWDTSDLSSGLTFCCSVTTLRRTIPTIPNLGRVGILYS